MCKAVEEAARDRKKKKGQQNKKREIQGSPTIEKRWRGYRSFSDIRSRWVAVLSVRW